MLENNFSYPRISLTQATQIWDTIKSLKLEEIQRICDRTTVAGVEFYPFAENRADDAEVQHLRRLVKEAAIRHGFPNQVSSRLKVAFESELMNILYDETAMTTSEASSMDVWHYFNLKLFADITLWRFGSFDSNINRWSISQDRLYAFNRNFFGRIWWRIHLLGLDLATRLGEDAVVAIVERPRVFSYPPFARAVATRSLSSDTDITATNLLREATIIFSRRMAVLSIFAMDRERMDAFVDDVFREAERKIHALLKAA